VKRNEENAMKSFKYGSLALALLAAPAFANVSVNVGLINVSPDDSSTHLNVVESVAGLPTDSTTVGVNSNTQLGLTFDYQLSPNWTVELVAATPFSHDIKVQGSAIDGLAIGKTKHLPPTLLAQYHFSMNDDRFDPFIGVGVNYTKFFNEKVSSDLTAALQALHVTTTSDDVELSLKDSVGLALQAGLNVKLSENWGVHMMVSIMDIDTTGRVKVNGTTIQSVDVSIDPYVWMLGVRYSM